jgi:hypothetical protein
MSSSGPRVWNSFLKNSEPGPGRNAPSRAVGHEVAGLEEALLGQAVQGKEQGVAGEAGPGAVGRVAPAGRAHGQHLPPGLAGGGEPFGEAQGALAEVADAVRAGQRARMEQDAARPRLE